ncbi:hypothetical protein DCO58_08065 [Helicobacter saguini]|uniref:Uncharacterized protein n=1 Tax=Helicobacter saguini TaxID=1548018 RepID=A0A347VNL6_9HELI|nr:hypothetical protein [Helicobacter saguini]MWV61718.1 hypothetical protein [Helicobacter saguini]MWV67610.1 hypothetical protein [Helicobacter saguini]MWV69961.1 hypothetical protein [Helicobacter saguini]MWV72825.1 hypothetical protein [Helicobacter saguini]TLD92367.1 hypothetical protein LS64_010250 [Helicobacter saguini]
MIVSLETDNKELIKAIRAMARLANVKVRTLDDTKFTKANKRAWIKARKELENGEAISHEKLRVMLKRR